MDGHPAAEPIVGRSLVAPRCCMRWPPDHRAQPPSRPRARRGCLTTGRSDTPDTYRNLRFSPHQGATPIEPRGECGHLTVLRVKMQGGFEAGASPHPGSCPPSLRSSASLAALDSLAGALRSPWSSASLRSSSTLVVAAYRSQSPPLEQSGDLLSQTGSGTGLVLEPLWERCRLRPPVLASLRAVERP